MKKRNILLIASFCVVLAVLVSFSGCDETDLFGEDKYAEKLNRTFDSEGISTIDAQTENGAITLVGSNSDQVFVDVIKEVRARRLDDAEEFAKKVHIFMEHKGSQIQIYAEYPDPPSGMDVSVHYEIQSPNRVNADLHTSNGKIEIHNIAGTIDAVTSNGMIDLKGGTSRIDLHTSNGKIKLQGTSGRVHASTSNSAIEASLEELTEESVFSTSNGSIDITVHNGIAPLIATTDNGSIDVTLPGDFSGKLDARTTNGYVSSEFSITGAQDYKDRLVGPIGRGGEATVTLRSSNGNITLRKSYSDTTRRRR